MLRFIVYEDNPDGLERLVSIIHKAMAPYDFEYKIDKYAAYDKEIKDIILNTYDQKIYILDIEVPKVSGLEIASSVRQHDWKSVIIFVTSHLECKNDVFYSRLLALDYISKYNTYDKILQESIEKAIQMLSKSRILSYKYNYVSYRIDFDEILYIEKISNCNKCLIHTENGGKLEISGGMKDIIVLLDNSFFMAHKSCIINLDKIHSIDPINNIITFKNNIKIDKLSSRNKKELVERINSYE